MCIDSDIGKYLEKSTITIERVKGEKYGYVY